jgi:hypothetical protein
MSSGSLAARRSLRTRWIGLFTFDLRGGKTITSDRSPKSDHSNGRAMPQRIIERFSKRKWSLFITRFLPVGILADSRRCPSRRQAIRVPVHFSSSPFPTGYSPFPTPDSRHAPPTALMYVCILYGEWAVKRYFWTKSSAAVRPRSRGPRGETEDEGECKHDEGKCESRRMKDE